MRPEIRQLWHSWNRMRAASKATPAMPPSELTTATMPPSELTTLASRISALTTELTTLLTAANAPSPSLTSLTAPETYPPDEAAQATRLALIDAATQLRDLAIGPAEWWKMAALTCTDDLMLLTVFTETALWTAVPLSGPGISHASLSAKTGIPPRLLARLLRHAMTLGLFTSTNAELITHTPLSATVCRNEGIRSFLGHCTDEVARGIPFATAVAREEGEGPKVGRTVVARALWPGCGDEVGFWKFLEEEPWRVERFGRAMRGMGVSMASLVEGFAWGGLGEGLVVDVGGSLGHVSCAIAAVNPDLKFVVQDVPKLAAEFESVRPVEFRDRVSFQAHDFFAEQPVRGADVYLFKHILHDWADAYALRIIRALVPALKTGARIVVFDAVLPPRGVLPNHAERLVTALDLQMWMVLGARERSAEMWRELFSAADSRLSVVGIKLVDGGMGIVEVEFKG
ncbi:S-adenosyl-L-methionine-dependent methyltransferase [Trichodelitschia bisporula]|uniref:S-adenosyl-L-methionine-dependent methyltransferase n=1 Tax=Trichodelitschia bisporula TaxID=703511 RepID=A0A6G1I1M2_9PEZI|nr:S-adenosyl-L-methionine-dependent methyltransferase [Trichodelitschia bisporula]